MQGLVPSNYLQEIDEFQDDGRPSHVSQGNRGAVRPMAQRDRNRGHGPGARGPPPPPRDGMPPRSDGRDRRKGIRINISIYRLVFVYRISNMFFFCSFLR